MQYITAKNVNHNVKQYTHIGNISSVMQTHMMGRQSVV